MKKTSFKLFVCNFLPESLFVKQYGKNVYEKIYKKTVNKGYCSACGHESNSGEKLQLHIYNVDKNNPENSKAVFLCGACHITQHIDFGIANNFFTFVNSAYSQEDLVRACRFGDLRKLYKTNKLINIKKTPQEILEEIQDGTFKPTTTLKVVFTDNFQFNDL